jgi:hypothetical protein
MIFRIQGSGFRVQDSGFRVQGSGFRVQGSGLRAQGSGYRIFSHPYIEAQTTGPNGGAGVRAEEESQKHQAHSGQVAQLAQAIAPPWNLPRYRV